MDEALMLSPPLHPSKSTNNISKSISLAQVKPSLGNPYNVSYLLKRMQGETSSKKISLQPRINIQRQSINNERKSLFSNPIVLKDIHKQQQVVANKSICPLKQIPYFDFDQLKRTKNTFGTHQVNTQTHGRRRKQYKKFFK